jgi:hypothetical protein
MGACGPCEVATGQAVAAVAELGLGLRLGVVGGRREASAIEVF